MCSFGYPPFWQSIFLSSFLKKDAGGGQFLISCMSEMSLFCPPDAVYSGEIENSFALAQSLRTLLHYLLACGAAVQSNVILFPGLVYEASLLILFLGSF